MSLAVDELSERIRLILGEMPHVREQKMFGGRAFMLAGNMVVAPMKDGSLLVRVGKEGMDEALSQPGASRMEMNGRSMGGFVVVSGDAVEDDEVLAEWVARGRRVAEALPPK
mgnify:CR=1 FL=1